MTETGAIVRRVLVDGHVQGVGYREFTRRAALKLGVSGWVRNRYDGAVEALIRGPPSWRKVAMVLFVPASNRLRTRPANSGASFSMCRQFAITTARLCAARYA